jgi:hypothetical protein
MCIHKHTHLQTLHACIPRSRRIYPCLQACIHAFMHTETHTRTRTHLHAHLHEDMNACTVTCSHARMLACMHTFILALVADRNARIHVRTVACTRTCLHTGMRVHVDARSPSSQLSAHYSMVRHAHLHTPVAYARCCTNTEARVPIHMRSLPCKYARRRANVQALAHACIHRTWMHARARGRSHACVHTSRMRVDDTRMQVCKHACLYVGSYACMHPYLRMRVGVGELGMRVRMGVVPEGSVRSCISARERIRQNAMHARTFAYALAFMHFYVHS